jgi:hypothetical protein
MEGCNRGVWDQAIIERLLAGRYRAPCWPDFVHHDALADVPDAEGAVVVLPARHHTSLDDLRRINEATASLPWLLLILNGDEEHSYPYGHVEHPNMRLWVQTPDATRTYPPGTRYLANGPATLAYDTPWGERTRDVVLLAQDTHARRHECADAVQAILDTGRPGHLTRTAGFTQGVEPAEYMALMASARVCPAPSGPVCVDSFRAWEAMELGAVPVLDGRTPGGGLGVAYWVEVIGSDATFPGSDAAFPVVSGWDELAAYVDHITADWPAPASRAAAWWMRYQRDMARRLVADLRDLGAPTPAPSVDDQITVLMPTSPIPSHPSTAVIEETIDSVRAQLPRAEILVMCDGVRPAQEHYRQRYEEYLYELVRLCREKWSNVLPVIHPEHRHQSGMTRHALNMVTTPTIMFAEHDCPILGDISWAAITHAVRGDRADVVRLHHEASVLPVHEYLMDGPDEDVAGARMRPTRQWSQRPHVARTAYYRDILRDHFGSDEKWMLEDRMHSVAQSDPGAHHLWILTEPNGEHGIKYSWHLDGRGDDSKWVDR